nr:putative reverse transcriptase domain-containing protein [Tanacetum cinerariifolium]GFA06915.1 putative reverse transcriptase domain-containing protein [Tanacetum cinerariifolium]
MPSKRTSTSAAPTMTQDAIRQLVANSVTVALEAQASTMANTNNLNRNTRPREAPVAKKENYKEFISCQPFYFNGTEGAVWLIRCDHKHKFDDRRSSNNNNNYPNNHVSNYQNNRNNNSNRNNDYRQQQNKRPETFISYAATPIEKSGYTKKRPCKQRTSHWEQSTTSIGVDKSFVSISLASMLNIPPITLDTTNDIEMANGNLVVSTSSLEWIGYPNIMLKSSVTRKSSTSHRRGCHVFIAQLMKKKSDEKGLEDIPVVREFLEVFLEELPGLPSVRQVEFQIELVLGAAPVARAPYRLDPLEMQELSNQL